MDEITDIEVLDIMRDGGRKLCEYAIEQWVLDKYKLGEQVRRENIQRWNAIKARITELSSELKGTLKDRGNE